jgi:Uma2 family endonuclease
MTAMSTSLHLPRGPWTADDLEQLPDDGLRYEVIDGMLLVSACPSVQHQRVARNLGRLLEDAAPDELEVFPLPLGVRSAVDREIQPDLVVVRREDATGRRLSGLPLLVVEVQSPSTRMVDLMLKRQVLQDAGVPSYWLVDPDDPSLTVLELSEGAYVEVARVSAGDAWTAERPFPVTVVPAELLT